MARFQPDMITFNDLTYDQDFRVESANSSHMLFVDAANNQVGIGTSSPDATGPATLDVNGNMRVDDFIYSKSQDQYGTIAGGGTFTSDYQQQSGQFSATYLVTATAQWNNAGSLRQSTYVGIASFANNGSSGAAYLVDIVTEQLTAAASRPSSDTLRITFTNGRASQTLDQVRVNFLKLSYSGRSS